MNFKIHLEPFDKSYGDLGDYKVIVVAGNPVEYKLAPTEAQITNKILPKNTGQSDKNARYNNVMHRIHAPYSLKIWRFGSL